jgi:RimJ/RimL family protein N-acetyltransferase
MPSPAADTIHRYPTELIDVVHLTDGKRVVVRPVLPQDRELMVAFFHDLSADARCGRFMHPVNEPSSELLREFTHVDHANHVALVAELFVDGRETVIGEARYVRAADPASAEVSVSVAEPWQGKGLANLMLTKLERRAAAVGVRRIIGETLATNEKIISLARKAGFVISESARGVMRLEKTLALRDDERSCTVFEFVVNDGVKRS